MTMGEPAREASASVLWPVEGVVRVHFEPAALPQLGDEQGGNRFDDPRPRTVDRYLMRYAATTLRGCLLELLDALRDDPEASLREAAVDDDAPDRVDAPKFAAWQAVHDFLDGRELATITADQPAVVSINDPGLQRELDQEAAVRAVLDGEPARTALLETGGTILHLDNAAVRLSSETGRDITQACALALFDRDTPPDVIHYPSRHDDREDCWAIYNHTPVRVGPQTKLSPEVPEHVEALQSVAAMWGPAASLDGVKQ